MRKPRRAATLVGSAVIALAGTLVAAPPVAAEPSNSAPSDSGDPIDITVQNSVFAHSSTNTTPHISIDSLWLSDYQPLVDDDSTIAQHLATLAGDETGMLRVGAIGADKTYWSRLTESEDPTPSWATRGRIAPEGVEALATMSEDAGDYGVILSTNMYEYNPGTPELVGNATDYIAEARAQLGSRLSGAIIGNEPDLYPAWHPTRVWARWRTIRDALRVDDPSLPLYGPTTTSTSSSNEDYQYFLERQQSVTSVQALSTHDYYLSMCSEGGQKQVTIENLLSKKLYDTTRTEADRAAADARSIGVPAVWDERNSVSCAGKAGVSDVYAAALWGLDSTMLIARSGVSEQYLHSAFGQCGGDKPRNTYYSPFCAETADDVAHGRIQAQPLYYGLLAASRVGDGEFLNSTVTDETQARVRFYALRQGSSISLVMVNVDESDTTVNVTLPGSYTTGSRVDLTGPSLTSTSGITFGGQSVSPEGTIDQLDETPVGITDGNAISVDIGSYSAAIIKLS